MTQSYFSHGPRLSETKAKQGTRGRHVFWILIMSLALSCAALFVVWAFNARDLPSLRPVRALTPPAGASPVNRATPPSPRDL